MMTAIDSVQEVYDAIARAKTGASLFCTNFYPSQEKLVSWIARRMLYVHDCRDAVFFLESDRDFWHLYFCAASRDALRLGLGSLIELKTVRVVADILGDSQATNALLPPLHEAGLQPYKQLVRMALLPPLKFPLANAEWNNRVSLAERRDAPAVLSLIERNFDRYAKQIPSIDEIETAIDSCRILTIQHGGALAGLLFFETRGVTSTLRFWTVADEFRDAHIGSALMRRYLESQTEVRRFLLWVNTDNEDALNKYRHYHYETDGVVDYVLANEWIRR